MLTISDDRAPQFSKLVEFIRDVVLPAEARVTPTMGQLASHDATVIGDLQATAKRCGLWNLLVDPDNPLSFADQALVAEVTGWSPFLAPYALNSGPPDSVNLTMLAAVANDEQREMIMRPLLDGTVRSAFAMTERHVASSDANNIATSIVRDGDEYVITGHKWYISGATNPACRWLFVLGVTDKEAPRHGQHSIVAVPTNAPGVTIVRSLPVLGFSGDQAEVVLDHVRVPRTHLLGDEGAGFAVAQTRLASARLHHACRQVGTAERALVLASERVQSRTVGGVPLAENAVVRQQLAEMRLRVQQARLMNWQAAHRCDATGPRSAQSHISAAKVVAMRMATQVIDRAMAMFGATGLSDQTPLSRWWAEARALYTADGPEEVHLDGLGRRELSGSALVPDYLPVSR